MALPLGTAGCASPRYEVADAGGVSRCTGSRCDAGAPVFDDAGYFADGAQISDAGTGPSPSGDAAPTMVEPDGAVVLASAARPLLGHYAIRARWFARDSQNLVAFT